MIEPLLLTAARVLTFEQQRPLTNASGFFFERDKRLFLVTSRRVEQPFAQGERFWNHTDSPRSRWVSRFIAHVLARCLDHAPQLSSSGGLGPSSIRGA